MGKLKISVPVRNWSLVIQHIAIIRTDWATSPARSHGIMAMLYEIRLLCWDIREFLIISQFNRWNISFGQRRMVSFLQWTHYIHGAQSFKKANMCSVSSSPVPYGTQGSITTFTCAQHCPLIWDRMNPQNNEIAALRHSMSNFRYDLMLHSVHSTKKNYIREILRKLYTYECIFHH